MYWKLALVQHPMYLLIKEDTLCAERTPPWGAPDIESYIARLRQNIAQLREHPQLKLGYEWSGLELEQLSQDAPEVFHDMLALLKAGQITFYNGTYSQPHLQTLSSEANYRQFEWGAKVYRGLCQNHQVLTYAHQESSVNEQTPQLLKAFGIRYGVLPRFTSIISMIDGGDLLFHSRFGTMFMHGAEFAGWRGLDSTVTDLFLAEPNHMHVKDWINYQEMLGLYHVPPVMIEMPDLVDIGEQWLDDRSGADFALLDEVLAERHQAFPSRFQVRFYTNWSYIEGIRAEELSRSNWKAEVSALRAEALNSLAFALLKRAAESTDPIWKTILTTQHHDVYCFCAPELRQKSILRLQEAQREAMRLATSAAQAIVAQVDTSALDGQPLVVLNTFPHFQQGVVTAQVALSNPMVTNLAGTPLACDVTALTAGNSQVRFMVRLSGLGYRTFTLKAGGAPNVEHALDSPFTFENESYRAIVQPDGTMTSLVVNSIGEELLAGATKPANKLAAHDSTGLGPTHQGTFDISRAAEKWQPPARGDPLHWQPSGPTTVRHSPLGATLNVMGNMGPTVQASLTISFYHAIARIDLDWTFAFDEASLGHFFADDTKLRVQWPLAFSGAIHHDIAFGVVEARGGRPFLPSSWTDISDGRKGFAYFHQGTLKHWVVDQVLVNLFAWGEETDAIGNRMDMTRWPKCFDQRLRGTHKIPTAIYPHRGDWRSANVIGAARSYGMPPLAYVADAHPGKLPADMNVFELADNEIVSTAIKTEGSRILCRLYSAKQNMASVGMVLNGLKADGLLSLLGDPLEQPNAFQIAHLYLV